MNFRYPVFGNRAMNMSPGLYHLVHGKKLPGGMTYKPTCGNPLCCNPKHRAMRKARSVSHPYNPLRVAKITATMRARSRIPEEAIREMRESNLSSTELAKKWNLSVPYVCDIQKHKRRPDRVGTISVFGWRP